MFLQIDINSPLKDGNTKVAMTTSNSGIELVKSLWIVENEAEILEPL